MCATQSWRLERGGGEAFPSSSRGFAVSSCVRHVEFARGGARLAALFLSFTGREEEGEQSLPIFLFVRRFSFLSVKFSASSSLRACRTASVRRALSKERRGAGGGAPLTFVLLDNNFPRRRRRAGEGRDCWRSFFSPRPPEEKAEIVAFSGCCRGSNDGASFGAETRRP